MVSSSSMPFVSEMAELRANGLDVLIFFPIDANGFAHVFPFTLVSSSPYKMVRSRSKAIFMISLPLCCLWPYMRSLVFLATNHQYGKSRLVNTRSTDSLNLGQMYPPKSRPLFVCPFPLWTPLPPSMSRLNPVYTLSYTFVIPMMVMSLWIPLQSSSHHCLLSIPLCDPPSCTPWPDVSSCPIVSPLLCPHVFLTLTYYKDLNGQVITNMRHWGLDVLSISRI